MVVFHFQYLVSSDSMDASLVDTIELPEPVLYINPNGSLLYVTTEHKVSCMLKLHLLISDYSSFFSPSNFRRYLLSKI